MPRNGMSVSPIDGLTERQRLAAQLLARGDTIRAVSRQLNVSEKTIYLYRQKPEVQKAIYEFQTTSLDQSGGASIESIPAAMIVLNQIIQDPNSRDADRIAAARTLMNSAAGFSERKMLERQIRDLEKALVSFASDVKDRSMPSADPSPEGEELDPLLPSAAVDDEDQ